MTSGIGQWRRREDGAAKVLGRAAYTGDLKLPGMAYARLVLSPYPRARILSIDADAARSLPGVIGVFSADDLPLVSADSLSRSLAPLARGETIFDGQPLAVVLADSEEIADDAVGLVQVEYEELEPAVDAEASLASPDPLVHGAEQLGARGDAGAHTAIGGSGETADRPANAADALHYVRGDVAAAFASADLVIERTYRTPWVHQSYLEPQSSIAVPDGTGRITIYCSTQAAYTTRDFVAKALGIAAHCVNVVTMEIGGGFGAKYALIDPLAAGLAWAIGRPVRLVYTRRDEFLAANPAPATVVHLKTGVQHDGTLTALQATVVADTGAYPGDTAAILATLLGGTYRWPNLSIDAYDVFTHKPGSGAYRAPGAPQACFAIESQMDEMAAALRLDPLEFRLRNAVTEGDALPDGSAWPRIGSREVLEALQAHPAWRDRGNRQPGEGVGIAFAGWAGATEPASAACRLNADGTLTVIVGSADISGTRTGIVLLAADAFGTDPAAINVVTADTDTAPFAPASGGSKITYAVGAAVQRAAADARRQVLEIAADSLEVAVDDLEIEDDRVQVRGVPGRGLSLREIGEKSTSFGQPYEPVFGRGRVAQSNSAPGFIAHLARVQVDDETGAVEVREYVAAQDVGRAINPAGIDDQIRGGVAQGIGWALYEQLVYDGHGRLQTGSFMDYALPSAHDIPNVIPVILEVPSPEGPLGARGVGEPPIIGGAAAIANAICDATSARLTELPMTPERVLSAIRAARG